MVIIVMIVPPGLVFSLLIGVPFFELSMVAVGFDLPTLVVGNLTAIPHMVSPRDPGRRRDKKRVLHSR
jgi:hypothetical protein